MKKPPPGTEGEKCPVSGFNRISRRRFLALSALTAWRGSAAASTSVEKPVSVLCIDAKTGRIFHQEHADVLCPPASLVKLMQFLLVSEGVEAGLWQLDQNITISAKAQRMGGAQLLLAKGENWSLGHLMQATAVASANDAAMAIAENLWNSEENYVRAMNLRAAELGMLNTVFHSVHGLPPDPGKEHDITTAQDMALLAQVCIQHPRILEWTSQKEFQLKPGGATFYNTNKLLWRMKNCDGLKTGFIRAAGFCIVATAKQEEARLISVVLGCKHNNQRFQLAQEMMEKGFNMLRQIKDNQVSPDSLPVLEGTIPPGWRLEVSKGSARWHGLPEKSGE